MYFRLTESVSYLELQERDRVKNDEPWSPAPARCLDARRLPGGGCAGSAELCTRFYGEITACLNTDTSQTRVLRRWLTGV